MVQGARTDSLVKEQQCLKALVPAPMNTMLEKKSASEAIAKRVERQQMEIICVPSTLDGSTPSTTKKKRAPHCSSCHQPMKGHKNVNNCPKNL